MNVLSLFDGMSCGQIALNRCGIKYDNYYASEIDKYAITVTQANYPDTIQLGDIRNIKAAGLPKINLLIGGSPCQGFSFAGKQLNFEDERSKLFFEYVRLLKECKPEYFLLENVKMKKEYEDIISSYLGCKPIRINSALVSAQNRQRLYWTNIPVLSMPEDKGIVLKDIIESGEVDREKSYCIDANYYKGTNEQQYLDKARRQIVYGAAQRGRYNLDGTTSQQVELNETEKSNALTGVQKDSLVLFGGARRGRGDEIRKDLKSNALLSDGHQSRFIASQNHLIRKLTPIECERLQTVPDNYTNHVSNTQRYKMLGNGWTVDVICHIFSFVNLNT